MPFPSAPTAKGSRGFKSRKLYLASMLFPIPPGLIQINKWSVSVAICMDCSSAATGVSSPMRCQPNVFSNANVYLYDFQAGTNFLISQNPNTLQPANGASDSPDISADGRFIAYRSAATDLVPGSTNGIPQLIVYDQLAGANTLLSTAATSTASGDNRSLTPVFSGDGRTLVFASWASNLATNDFNHFSDVFAFEFLYVKRHLGRSGPGTGHHLAVRLRPHLSGRIQGQPDRQRLAAGRWHH